ncbi:Uncharacterised protein [Burkholderia pseudomallei]|nr:Uncharacterised protein [Burkholderia pseudomallei]
MMHRHWINVADELPARRHAHGYSAFVIVWVECENGLGFWEHDRFDHPSRTWETFEGDGQHVTHWMHGPDSPHDPP